MAKKPTNPAPAPTEEPRESLAAQAEAIVNSAETRTLEERRQVAKDAEERLAEALVNSFAANGLPLEAMAHLRSYARLAARTLAQSAVLPLVVETRIAPDEGGDHNG